MTHNSKLRPKKKTRTTVIGLWWHCSGRDTPGRHSKLTCPNERENDLWKGEATNHEPIKPLFAFQHLKPTTHPPTAAAAHWTGLVCQIFPGVYKTPAIKGTNKIWKISSPEGTKFLRTWEYLRQKIKIGKMLKISEKRSSRNANQYDFQL